MVVQWDQPSSEWREAPGGGDVLKRLRDLGRCLGGSGRVVAAATDRGFEWLRDIEQLWTNWQCGRGFVWSPPSKKCPGPPREFSRRQVLLAAAGGLLAGYVLGKYVEPAVRAARRKVVAGTRVRVRELCVRVDTIWKKGGLFSSRRKKTPPTSQKKKTTTNNAKNGLHAARPRSLPRPNSLGRQGSITEHVDVVSIDDGVMVDATALRANLQDGDLVCLSFDGASYRLKTHPTFAAVAAFRQNKEKLLKRKGSGRHIEEGRVIDDCVCALSKFTIFDEDPSKFAKAADKYVDDDQRTRYGLALRVLAREACACVAILRLIRRPAEPSEPPRPGDVVVVWVPSEHDPTRSLVDRTATTPIIVNQLVDAITANRVLAPYTIRVEANKVDDIPYDSVYKKLFQVPVLR